MERVVPTGHVFVIFEFDNITRNLFNNQTLQSIAEYKKVWVSGMHDGYITISAHLHSEMLVVQFKSAGAFPFFHFPLIEIKDKVISGEEIFGKEIVDLRNRMLAAEETEAKFQLVDKWLMDRYDERKTASRDLLVFIDKLREEPVCKLKQIIKTYPSTQKQLILHFKKYLGVTPKHYQRIMRFNEILKSIQSKEKISWADIAYNCDYSDQSHFIKEFFFFSGLNPQEFIRKNLSPEEYTFIPINTKG